MYVEDTNLNVPSASLTAKWKEERQVEGAKEVPSVSRIKKSLEPRQLSATERPQKLRWLHFYELVASHGNCFKEQVISLQKAIL